MEYKIQDTTLTAIADAINAKTGESGQMTPLEMPGKIESILSGGVKSYYTTFSASDWNNDEIVIPAATHGLSGAAVMAQFSVLVDGVYYPHAWAAIESYVTVNATTGAITLHCYEDTEYNGAVMLIG